MMDHVYFFLQDGDFSFPRGFGIIAKTLPAFIGMILQRH